MELTLTDGIAGLALLVSALSAIAASKAAGSAEISADSAVRANDIAQHNERLAIYKALQKFNYELQRCGNTLPDSALWPFADAANISEFYYPQSVAKDLQEIVDAAYKYLTIRDEWKALQEAGATQERDKARQALLSLNKQGSDLRKMCKEYDERLRAHLRKEQRDQD